MPSSPPSTRSSLDSLPPHSELPPTCSDRSGTSTRRGASTGPVITLPDPTAGTVMDTNTNCAHPDDQTRVQGSYRTSALGGRPKLPAPHSSRPAANRWQVVIHQFKPPSANSAVSASAAPTLQRDDSRPSTSLGTMKPQSILPSCTSRPIPSQKTPGDAPGTPRKREVVIHHDTSVADSDVPSAGTGARGTARISGRPGTSVDQSSSHGLDGESPSETGEPGDATSSRHESERD